MINSTRLSLSGLCTVPERPPPRHRSDSARPRRANRFAFLCLSRTSAFFIEGEPPEAPLQLPSDSLQLASDVGDLG